MSVPVPTPTINRYTNTIATKNLELVHFVQSVSSIPHIRVIDTHNEHEKILKETFCNYFHKICSCSLSYLTSFRIFRARDLLIFYTYLYLQNRKSIKLHKKNPHFEECSIQEKSYCNDNDNSLLILLTLFKFKLVRNTICSYHILINPKIHNTQIASYSSFLLANPTSTQKPNLTKLIN
jgi:hypothetical protein